MPAESGDAHRYRLSDSYRILLEMSAFAGWWRVSDSEIGCTGNAGKGPKVNRCDQGGTMEGPMFTFAAHLGNSDRNVWNNVTARQLNNITYRGTGTTASAAFYKLAGL